MNLEYRKNCSTRLRSLQFLATSALLFCLHSYAVGKDSNRCGERTPSKYRIVGGKESEVGAWPWMALLFLPLAKGKAPEPACGGALITPRHVLTAAHCLHDDSKEIRKPSTIRVRLGEHNLNKKTESPHIDLAVSRVLPHEHYDENLVLHDVGLLLLEKTAPLGKNIRLVCLPKDKTRWSHLEGRTVVVAGWGAQEYEGKMSRTLQEVMLPILSPGKCTESFAGLMTLDNTTFCAGAEGGKKDSCTGDSGGPVVVQDEKRRFTVVGVTAFGVRCGSSDFPGVYTRVTEHLDWIRDKIRETQPG